jgi:hypothetical protein
VLSKVSRASRRREAREFSGGSCGHDRTWRQVFHGHGLNIAVQSNDRTLLDALALESMPGLSAADGEPPDLKYTVRVTSAGGRPRCDVYLGTRRLADGIEADGAPIFVRSHVESTVASAAPTEVFVHAGAVAWNGRLILLPGSSHAGKTTLVREFLDRGAAYFSDEFAVVDFSGRIHAYPRPLNLRNGEGLLDKNGAGKYEHAWKTAVRAVRPELVVFAQYQPLGRWHASRLTPGGTVLELMSHTVAARSRTKFALHCLKEIAGRVAAYRAVRGEAAMAADEILRLLAGVHMSTGNK